LRLEKNIVNLSRLDKEVKFRQLWQQAPLWAIYTILQIESTLYANVKKVKIIKIGVKLIKT